MKRSPLAVALSLAFLAACAAPQREQAKNPFADNRLSAPGRKLSLALLLPPLKLTRKGKPVADSALVRESASDPGKVYRDLLGVYYQGFRSVTLVRSLEDPKVAEADIVGSLEVAVVEGALSVVSSFYSLDHSLVTTIKTEAKGGSPFFTASEKIYALLMPQIPDKLESALNGSSELRQYARGQETRLTEREKPAAAAESPSRAFDSDVDRPSYGLSDNADNFAVVIGVESYQSLPPASFASRDAKAMSAHLRALGYPAENIALLTDSQATGSKIKSYVESWLPRNVKPQSKVFVYFSGHGAPETESKQAYLVPWDGDAQFLAHTGYSLKRLYEKLNRLPAKKVIVAMDSCFSGAGGHSVLAKGARPLMTKVDVGESSGMGKVVVLAASGADEITGEESNQGHGLFTYYLLKGLNEQGGQATAGKLYGFLKPKVEAAARQGNRNQTPQLLLSDSRADDAGLR